MDVFSLLLTVTSTTALPWDVYFFKITEPLTVSTVQLLYTRKDKGGKSDRKPYPFPYGLRNSYRNLKSENSQDYSQKPQRNCSFMNSASGCSVQNGTVCRKDGMTPWWGGIIAPLPPHPPAIIPLVPPSLYPIFPIYPPNTPIIPDYSPSYPSSGNMTLSWCMVVALLAIQLVDARTVNYPSSGWPHC